MSNFGDRLFLLLHKALLRRAARREIEGRNRRLNEAQQGKFDRADIKRVLERVWRHYQMLAPEVQAEPTIGAAHNARFACLALCLLKALTDEGVDRPYARILISDTLWRTYRIGASVPLAIARLLSLDPKRRIRICVRTFTVFPFGRPGYQYEVVSDDSPETAIAIKWTRCPKIDFLKEHKAEDLCLECLCNLDYPLLEFWGGRFDRPCTQAEGAPYCHMRFNTLESESALSGRTK